MIDFIMKNTIYSQTLDLFLGLQGRRSLFTYEIEDSSIDGANELSFS